VRRARRRHSQASLEPHPPLSHPGNLSNNLLLTPSTPLPYTYNQSIQVSTRCIFSSQPHRQSGSSGIILMIKLQLSGHQSSVISRSVTCNSSTTHSRLARSSSSRLSFLLTPLPLARPPPESSSPSCLPMTPEMCDQTAGGEPNVSTPCDLGDPKAHSLIFPLLANVADRRRRPSEICRQ
jgi:hypothetical protein